MSARQALRVGIAGYGVVGKRRHECILRDRRMQVTAACDRTFGQEQLLPQGLRCFKTYQELLEEPLDVLVVCLTNDIAAENPNVQTATFVELFMPAPPRDAFAPNARL